VFTFFVLFFVSIFVVVVVVVVFVIVVVVVVSAVAVIVYNLTYIAGFLRFVSNNSSPSHVYVEATDGGRESYCRCENGHGISSKFGPFHCPFV